MALRLLALVLSALLWSTVAQAERRVALVIGNAAYKHATPLRNPLQDAAAVAETLRKLDFEVLVGTDLDKIGMEEIAKRFIRSLAGADVALLYYSGHAVQVGEQNYLIPVTANFNTLPEMVLEAYPVQDLYRLMEGDKERAGARIRLLFLDACRDNPFPERLITGSGNAAVASRGLAQVSADFGSLIGFSTAPGTVALDGDGRLSPFTTAFVERLAEPKAEVRKIMTKVRSDVVAATKGRQVPWDNSSLLTDFFFVAPRRPPVFEKLSIVSAKASGDQTAVALRLSPPRQPEGGAVRVAIDALPKFGALVLGQRPLAGGDGLTPEEFAALAYRGRQAGPVTDAFSFRVEDDWNNQETGFVTVSLDPGPAPAETRPSAVSERSDLGRIEVAGTSVLGLGPNLTLAVDRLPTRTPSAADTWLRLASSAEGGQLFLGDRLLESGRSLRLAELPQLAFVPSIGTADKVNEAVLVAEAPAAGQVRLKIRTEMHACDRLAGHRFDLQGVSEGVLPYHLDAKQARPACEAAVRDHPDVGRFHHQLGRAYLAEGRNREAFAEFEKAAALGHVRARTALGWFHLLGAYLPRDYARAKQEFEAAAARGDVFAQHALGVVYRNGQGVPKDPAKAREFFEKSARIGHTNSMNSLGELYSLGEGVTKDDALARRYWEASAERGDIFGINNLGFVYMNGAGVPKSPARALAYFKRAAELGHPEAPNNVGRIYANGIGVPVNKAEALKWYRLGSDRGDAWAALNLGELHRVGAGVKADPVAATGFYARAAALPQTEPADIARGILAKLPEATKLQALRHLLAPLDAGAAKLAPAQLLDRAASLAAERGARPESGSLDHVLIALAKAQWLSSGSRIDTL